MLREIFWTVCDALIVANCMPAFAACVTLCDVQRMELNVSTSDVLITASDTISWRLNRHPSPHETGSDDCTYCLLLSTAPRWIYL